MCCVLDRLTLFSQLLEVNKISCYFLFREQYWSAFAKLIVCEISELGFRVQICILDRHTSISDLFV